MKKLLACASLGILLIACSTTKTTQTPPVVPAASNHVATIETPVTNAATVAATVQPSAQNFEKCFENLSMIWGLKATWSLINKKGDDAIPSEADLSKVMRQTIGKDFKPVCPERGVYTIDRVAQYPSCSVHGRPDTYAPPEPPVTDAAPVAVISQPITNNTERCFQNLKVIWQAKALWAVEWKKPDGAIPTDADLFGPEHQKLMLEVGGREILKPVCPERGMYTIDRVDQYPSCSVHGRPEKWP